MLCWISMLGGLLIMMGLHSRSEALFYYFRLEDQIPETHLLRLIDKHVSFEFVRQQLKDSYSETGRPSIDPELLLRILLIGYLYGISSERRLVEELRMHLAWRWFTGLGFDQEIPHHSTFSKNRHGRFQAITQVKPFLCPPMAREGSNLVTYLFLHAESATTGGRRPPAQHRKTTRLEEIHRRNRAGRRWQKRQRRTRFLALLGMTMMFETEKNPHIRKRHECVGYPANA